MMKTEQRVIYYRVLTSIDTGGCYFLDSKAGRGKTLLVNAINNTLRCSLKRPEGFYFVFVVCMLATGVLQKRWRMAF